MRILFSVRNPSYVRHYEGVLRLCATRGHEVELAKDSPKPWSQSALDLAAAHPAIHLSELPPQKGDPWWELVTRLRQARFFLRFLDQRYEGMPALLARAREKASPLSVRLSQSRFATRLVRRHLVRVLNLLEQATRTPAPFHDYLRQRQPDIVVATPLVILKTAQLDLARAAIELGVRNVFAVASWDHLSSKGELTFDPQHLLVWNDVQRREAVELHSQDPARVIVTGSQVFDDWFDRTPSTDRDAFCSRVGLRADRPFLLYVCSALLEGGPPEPEFVARWARALRASAHPALRTCGILVRPHFKRGDEWRHVNFEGLDNISCWPRAGDVPVDARSKADYFDSMHHSAAVVGLNTSAMVEAAVVGRPVYSVLLPEYRDSQEGTVHFHYLLDGPDAVVRATRSFEAHVDDVAKALEARLDDPERSARFVRSFIRPGRADVPATTEVVNALESIGRAPAPLPRPAPAWTRLVRPMLRPFADSAARLRQEQQDAQRRIKEQALIEHRRARRAAEGQAPRPGSGQARTEDVQ